MNEPFPKQPFDATPIETDTEMGDFDGDILDAIRPFFPLEAQPLLIAHSPIPVRFRHVKRLFADARGAIHFFSTTQPLPNLYSTTGYNKLRLLLDAVYAAFPPVPGYSETYNYRHSAHYPTVFLSDASLVIHEALFSEPTGNA